MATNSTNTTLVSNSTGSLPDASATATTLPGDPNESYAANIIVCAVITWVLAAVFVGARFHTRWVIRRVLGWEDWTILIALVFSIGNSVGMVDQAVNGLGKHVWFVKPEQFAPLMRAGWYTILFYVLSLACTKISILLLYRRILTHEWARWATWALLIAVILSNLLYSTIVTLTACLPIQAWWDPSYGHNCHTQDWWWANTGMHMITDFLIFLLPLPLIVTLRIEWRQKVLLYGIFTFGFFICAVSIIRLVSLVHYAEHLDFSYDNVSISYWSCVEVNAAIICACQMTLKPLLSRMFPSLFREQRPRPGPVHAAVSIGGRPLVIGGGHHHHQQRKEGAGAPTNNNRRSWIPGVGGSGGGGGGGASAGIRLDSDAPIIEEDRPVSMRDLDLEAQKAEEDGNGNGHDDDGNGKFGGGRVGIRETTTSTRDVNESTDRLSDLGPEARANSLTTTAMTTK